MNGLAIFGTVLNEDGFKKWVDQLVDHAALDGVIAPDDAKAYREKLFANRRGAVPMILSENTSDDQTLTPERMAPADWGGKLAEYKWRIDPDDTMGLDHTHIVCFAGGERVDTPWPLWFDGHPIYSAFGICTWDERTNVYRHIHCATCAQTIIRWIISKQEAWRHAADPAAPKEATNEGPARLQ